VLRLAGGGERGRFGGLAPSDRRTAFCASARGRFPAAENTTVSCRTVCSSSSTV